LELRQASFDRKKRLEDQGWVEKHGRSGGRRVTSWSIRRINAEMPPTASSPALDKPLPKPRTQQPTPTKSNDKASSFLNGPDEEELQKYKDSTQSANKIGSLPAKEHIQVMAERAKQNSDDTSFRQRFAAMLKKHDGKKVLANAGNTNREAGNCDSDASNLSEMGGENDESKDEIIADEPRHKTNYSSLEAQFAEEMAKGMRRKFSTRPSRVDDEGSNNDADMSGDEAARKGEKKVRFKQDAIYHEDDANHIPRSKGSYTQRRVAMREIKSHKERGDEAFNQRFNEILAKHDGKKNQKDDGRMDVEMSHEATTIIGDNQGGKRKRDVKDEDEIMGPMQHAPDITGRKRQATNSARKGLSTDF
jgi:hypothetical protein